MHPLRRRQLRRRARAAVELAERRVWNPAAGLHFCAELPTRYLEPICDRVSRVQGESFDRLVRSIAAHGLANPIITVTELPGEPNHADWREWRYRFLYTIAAPIKIVVGHNRYAACLALGRTHVPVLHCGPIAYPAADEAWQSVDGIEAAQLLCRDGKLGCGPYSLVMDQFTPPLKGVPKGFEVPQ